MPTPRPTKRELTRSALLEAVQRTLLEEPPGALSVPRLVARAGVSQGTFYNYFDSLDAALDGVGLLLVAEHGRLVGEVTLWNAQTGAQHRHNRHFFTGNHRRIHFDQGGLNALGGQWQIAGQFVAHQ